MARRQKRASPAKSSASSICPHCGSAQCSCSHLWAVKGIILLLIGLALWRGFLSLDLTIAILLVLGGLKYLLKPLWMGRY